MTTTPASLFRYDVTSGGAHRLYAAPLTTADALACFDASTSARIIELGATGWKTLGWATEADLPALEDVGAMRALLEQPRLGLIICAIDIDGFGRLSSHDDGECTFSGATRGAILSLVAQLAPPALAGRLAGHLAAHPEAYLALEPDGAIARYASFDAWLARHGGLAGP